MSNDNLVVKYCQLEGMSAGEVVLWCAQREKNENRAITKAEHFEGYNGSSLICQRKKDIKFCCKFRPTDNEASEDHKN